MDVRLKTWLLVAVGAVGWSCANESASFACDQDSQCQGANALGSCEPPGFCSFPDETCESGRRYGASSDTVSGLCVPPAAGTDAGTTTASSDSSDQTWTSGDGSTSTDVTTATSGGLTSGATTTGSDSYATTNDSSGSSSSTTGVSDGSTSGAVSAGSTSEVGSSTTGLQEMTIEVLADLAECTDPLNNDPDLCEQNAGPGTMTIDDFESISGQPATGWLRFTIDPAVIGDAQVLALRLHLVATDAADAESQSSAEVFETEPFALADLFTAQPTLSDTVLAPDQGMVSPGQVVEFDLPASLVGQSAIHLALVNPTTNGVNYWNIDGAEPPRLLIDILQ